jgi:hypothetical protein
MIFGKFDERAAASPPRPEPQRQQSTTKPQPIMAERPTE